VTALKAPGFFEYFAEDKFYGLKKDVRTEYPSQGLRLSVLAKGFGRAFRPGIPVKDSGQAFRSNIPAKCSSQGFRPRRIPIAGTGAPGQSSGSGGGGVFLTGKKFLSSLSGCCLPSGRKAWYPESERKGL
jgi:hypothetical protein